MIRRDKSVLTVKLPPKTIEVCAVSPYISELTIYRKYESNFIKALKEFSQISSANNLRPEQRARQKNLFTILMATMCCMRMALIHPILPGGREITIQFSPTRRHLIGNLASEMRDKCVCCQRYPSQQQPKSEQKSDVISEAETAALAGMAVAADDEDLQDNSFGASSNTTTKSSKKRNKKDDRKLVPMDAEFCFAADGCPHYVHEDCLEDLKMNCDDELKCPKCKDFQARLHLMDQAQSLDVPHETYCEHVPMGPYTMGIKATAKINEIVEWAKAIPKGDKAILYSFFKASLDIMEGIFVEHLGIECARFDGDVVPEARSKELKNFKTSKTCRILIASVQSSGVGLNIVEANHVAFMDRWFNPCVHAQAGKCFFLVI